MSSRRCSAPAGSHRAARTSRRRDATGRPSRGRSRRPVGSVRGGRPRRRRGRRPSRRPGNGRSDGPPAGRCARRAPIRSSMAMIAPCAMYCSGGWAASPRRAILPLTQLMIGSRSNIRHQRSRHISGRPFWIGEHLPSKPASSSSGVPQSSMPAQALGDSKTATWLNISPATQGALHEVAARPDVDGDVLLEDLVLHDGLERRRGRQRRRSSPARRRVLGIKYNVNAPVAREVKRPRSYEPPRPGRPCGLSVLSG